jgi:CheY-like chemotaxis protein
MFQKAWPILVVDDEPDVLSITQLVLKDVKIDGVPLRISTARSKQDAIELLNADTGPEAAPPFAVAFIDVVMETDHAGLDLCEYIRQELRNQATQLFIRTGQAGIAPERSVVDLYDINGYFTKVETTEDKLYSLVKAGVRQHELVTASMILFRLLSQAIGKSNEAITSMMSAFAQSLQREPAGTDLRQFDHELAIVIGGSVFASLGLDQAGIVADCRRLNSLGGTRLNDEGDAFIFEQGALMFSCPASPSNDEAFMLYRGVHLPSRGRLLLDVGFLRALATLVTTSRRSAVAA